jgi:hypothetical protein
VVVSASLPSTMPPSPASQILATATNATGTRCRGAGWSDRTIHAERNVIKALGDVRQLDGADLYVVRLPHPGSWADAFTFLNSKPCTECAVFLRKAAAKYGLRRVFYTENVLLPLLPEPRGLLLPVRGMPAPNPALPPPPMAMLPLVRAAEAAAAHAAAAGARAAAAGARVASAATAGAAASSRVGALGRERPAAAPFARVIAASAKPYKPERQQAQKLGSVARGVRSGGAAAATPGSPAAGFVPLVRARHPLDSVVAESPVIASNSPLRTPAAAARVVRIAAAYPLGAAPAHTQEAARTLDAAHTLEAAHTPAHVPVAPAVLTARRPLAARVEMLHVDPEAADTPSPTRAPLPAPPPAAQQSLLPFLHDTLTSSGATGSALAASAAPSIGSSPLQQPLSLLLDDTLPLVDGGAGATHSRGGYSASRTARALASDVEAGVIGFPTWSSAGGPVRPGSCSLKEASVCAPWAIPRQLSPACSESEDGGDDTFEEAVEAAVAPQRPRSLHTMFQRCAVSRDSAVRTSRAVVLSR